VEGAAGLEESTCRAIRGQESLHLSSQLLVFRTRRHQERSALGFRLLQRGVKETPKLLPTLGIVALRARRLFSGAGHELPSGSGRRSH
jgi:hypothetical protein